jgi:hypothetical protein
MPSLTETREMPARRTNPNGSLSTNHDRSLLWIDTVGGFLLVTRPAVTIGGPTGAESDIQLLASLSRTHATIHRDNGHYRLQAHAPTRVNRQDVEDWAELSDGAEISLGRSVQLDFHQPNVLSASARLGFQSDHRPAQSLDGVVLVADTCLLGPGRDCHVNCPEWDDSVILIRRDRQWLVHSPRLNLEINGEPLRGEADISNGQIVTGPELRFHIEPNTPANTPTDASQRGRRT